MSLNDNFFDLKNNSSEFSSLGNSYLYAKLNTAHHHFADPIKIEGVLLLKVRRGTLAMDINLTRHECKANTLVIMPFGTLMNFVESSSDNEIDVMFFYKEFLQNVNINFTAISVPIYVERKEVGIELNDAESEHIDRYIDLLKQNIQSDIATHIRDNIASSILAALVYQLVGLQHKHIGDHSTNKGQRASRLAYVHDFVKLVHLHYTQERSVSFYAEQLYISPKYLSLLVKEATGKSASRWIDEFVLMEAKNMLRFSGKNVQQVAYSLNFTNQSSFGKYFKHLTGMSPTEYQKS